MTTRQLPRSIEGVLAPDKKARFALVATRFNEFIVDALVRGALDCLHRHGVDSAHITLVRVPGALELGPICRRLAKSGKVDGIVALGAVVRGSTPHFDLVASEAAKGCAQAAYDTGIPVGFGVLTTDTLEQAIERSGTKAGNKGWDAAASVLEMASLHQALSTADL